MIVGFYLLVVTILPNGFVTGDVIDYYENPIDCFADAVEREMDAEPGQNYICVKDFVEIKVDNQ